MIGNALEVINWIYTQDKDKLFEVKLRKNQRSLQQNKMLWELIHKIAQEQGCDDMEVYCNLLEATDAKSDYVITSSEMEDSLRKSFRGVKFIRIQQVNNKDCYVYKVYLGSSKMNTKEMTQLLDKVLDWCAYLQIPTERSYL